MSYIHVKRMSDSVLFLPGVKFHFGCYSLTVEAMDGRSGTLWRPQSFRFANITFNTYKKMSVRASPHSHELVDAHGWTWIDQSGSMWRTACVHFLLSFTDRANMSLCNRRILGASLTHAIEVKCHSRALHFQRYNKKWLPCWTLSLLIIQSGSVGPDIPNYLHCNLIWSHCLLWLTCKRIRGHRWIVVITVTLGGGRTAGDCVCQHFMWAGWSQMMDGSARYSTKNTKTQT